MRKTNRFIYAAGIAAATFTLFGIARASDDPASLNLTALVAEANGSLISGTASISIGEDGLRGRLSADHLKPGHAYTVWFFYIDGTTVGGPGRFASTVAEDDSFIFRGSVGGLQASSGAKIRLVMFNHSDLTALPPSCAHMPSSAVARANNLLTPACASMVASADFLVP